MSGLCGESPVDPSSRKRGVVRGHSELALGLIINFWNPFHETKLPYKGDCFIDLGPCTSWPLFALSLRKNLARLI